MMQVVLMLLSMLVLSAANSVASSAVIGRSRLRGDPYGELAPLPPAGSKDSVDNIPPADYQPPAEIVRSKVQDSIRDGASKPGYSEGSNPNFDPKLHPQVDMAHNAAHPGTGHQMEMNSNSQEAKQLEQWFSWGFWQLLVLCAVTLFFYSEVVYPLVHIFKRTLLVDAAIFFVQMLSFMIVAAVFATPESAGASHASALATIMMAISFLTFLVALSMVWGEKDKIKQKIDNDIGSLFCPLSRVIAVFLIVQGVLDESGSDFGSLTLFASMAALGIVFAIGDVIKDIVSYVFIRQKHVFIEDDFVDYQGELYQIVKVSWRNTTAYRMKTRSIALIPNSRLALCGINNQSKDDARVVEIDIPLPGEIPGENLQTIVRESWALLRGLEETGFKAFNGKRFECQIDTAVTGIYLGNILPGAGDGKEFPYVDLHLKLFGKYYFSKPPPWKQDGPEPPPEARQLDWMIQWKYQVEWFIVEIKKIVDRHAA